MSESHADRTHEHTDVPLIDAAPATPSHDVIVERNKSAPAPPDGDTSTSRDGTIHPEGHDMVFTTTAGILAADPEAEPVSVGSARHCPPVADLGMTELWSPPPGSDVAADLCYVHGLMGHPRRTWQHGKAPNEVAAQGPSQSTKGKKSLGIWKRFKSDDKDKSKETQPAQQPDVEAADTKDFCFWPFDLVPKDFSKIRIMTYGYDSHPSHFFKSKTTQMTMSQHARDLLTKVTNSRSECRGRPLIFVSHSLGGILVKDMIIESLKNKHQPHLQDAGNACRAIFFFGTPHDGAGSAEWGLMLSNIVGTLPGGFSAYKNILRGLAPNSEKLSSVNRDFFDLLDEPIPALDKIQIYSFQEGQPFTSIKAFDGKIVPDTSSFLNRRAIERNSFIQDANHMSMCRFKSADSAGYKDFKAALKDYLDVIRAKQDASKQATSRVIRPAAILKNLDFKERLVREQQLSETRTIKESFQWIWSSGLTKWLNGSTPLFWISGKPASGKSTLMSHIAKSKETKACLAAGSSQSWGIIYHFFDYRAGQNTRNNFEGFLRSFLYQMFSSLPDLALSVQAALSKEREEELHSNLAWTTNTGDLLEAFELALRKTSSPVCLFLDGLDEYEGQKVELVNLLKDICSARVKVCLASRPEPPFPDALGKVPGFSMDLMNRPGIEAFAFRTMQKFFAPTYDSDCTELQKLSAQIAENSEGVFLWARFALFELIDGKTKGEDDAALRRRLEEVPPELQDIYARIFQRRTNPEKELTSAILRLVCTAERTLTTTELHEAILLTGNDQRDPHQPIQHNDSKKFEKRMLAVTGGILETFPGRVEISGGEPRTLPFVQIIHRTVKTYLDSRGWTDLLGQSNRDQLGVSLWVQACAGHLKRTQKSSPIETTPWYGNTLTYKQPEFMGRPFQDLRQLGDTESTGDNYHLQYKDLHEYTVLFLPRHATAFERQCKRSSYPLLRAALSSAYVKQHVEAWTKRESFEVCSPNNFFSGSKTVDVLEPEQLAVAHELLFYVQQYLREVVRTVDAQPVRATLMPWTSAFQILGLPRSRKEDRDIPDRTGIRWLAIHCACEHPTPTQSDILKAVLKADPAVDDTELLFVLRRAGLNELQTVLSCVPPGRLVLWSTEDYGRGHQEGEVFPWKFPSKRKFGPLWELAKRDVTEETETMFDLFLRRGEDINNICGPAGTAIHSALLELPYSYHEEMLEMLIRKGASVHVSGPNGNALEFVWELANKYPHGKPHKYAVVYISIIHRLIELGAVNKRRDPNGMVPPVERMMEFFHDNDHFEECQRYYLHGPR